MEKFIMKCPKCGTENASFATVCSNCGTVFPNTLNKIGFQTKSQYFKVGAIVVLVAGIILGFAMGVLLKRAPEARVAPSAYTSSDSYGSSYEGISTDESDSFDFKRDFNPAAMLGTWAAFGVCAISLAAVACHLGNQETQIFLGSKILDKLLEADISHK